MKQKTQFHKHLSLSLEDRSEPKTQFYNQQQISIPLTFCSRSELQSLSLSLSQVSREYNPSLSRIIGKIKTLEIYTFYGLILILSYFAFERVLFQDSSFFFNAGYDIVL